MIRQYGALLQLKKILVACLTLFSAACYADQECVVLLHGLARTSTSMKPIEKVLAGDGYQVSNISYPSRRGTIEELAKETIDRGVEACGASEAATIHFVTHSMGGIIVRFYLENHDLPQLGRVVMLAPPNQGSEVVDNWQNVPGYGVINGPAGQQLGTDPDSIPRNLGPVSYPVGIIAGNRTMNLLLSLSLPNANDGKVSVESTKVEGMADFIEVPDTHTFIMRSDDVIQQVVHFLKHGRFARNIA